MNDKVKVLFSVDEFEPISSSRTTINPDKGYSITWASGDVIGIFPREGYQEPFMIPASQVGKSKASFDGGYWALKDGLTYNAYYPFDKTNFESSEMKTQIPVTYLGQEQTGNTCCAGAFDYTYSDWMEATNGTVSFKFHHIGAIVVFNLEYPATATYTQLTLSADEAVIPTMGSYDLTANNVSFVPENTKKANSISLSLKNHTGTSGETGTFYMMLPPMDLSNNKLTVTLTSSSGTSCTYTVESKKFVKAMLYELTGTPTGSNVEGSVDGWGKEDKYSEYHVATAGTLSTIVPAEEKYSTASMKVTGNLNGDDIVFIRDMAGVGSEYSMWSDCLITSGKLTELDLSEATISEGGNSYYYIYDPDGNTGPSLPDFGSDEFSLSRGVITTSYYTSNNVIGTNMFKDCKLKTIKLPNKTIAIEDNAFANTQLTKVYCCIATPPTLSSTAFSNIDNSITLYVPIGYKNNYSNSSNWNNFATIEEEGEADETNTIPYLTFKADAEQTLTMSKAVATLEYSVNGGEWKELGVNTITFGGDNGDLRLRGKSVIGTASSTSSYSSIKFGSSKILINCTGDIRTLIDYENYETASTKTARFIRLFDGCDALISAPNLPAKTLASACYASMFAGCGRLTTAPELPAETLSTNCYAGMFYNCFNLEIAPELPAKLLAESCYYNMFYGCRKLATAPELVAITLKPYCYEGMFMNCVSLKKTPNLPASTLKRFCYHQMFYGCTNLSSITMLATNIDAENCLYDWVTDISSSGTFIKAKDMSILPTGTSGIPQGWSVKNYGE